MDQNQIIGDRSLYKCSDIEQNLDCYMDGSLEAPKLRSFEAHLSSCVSCKKLVAELCFIRELAGSLAEAEVPTGIKERLRARLAEEADWSTKPKTRHLRLVK